MPLHPFALAVLLLALPPALDLLAPSPARAQQATPLPSLQRGPEALALRRIEATQQLPGGGFAAVKVAGRDALYYLSNDGRILIKGTAYDLWSGRTLSTLADVQRSATRLDLAGFQALWPQLDPIELGSGPATVVAFVSPACPHCQSLIDQAQALTQHYRFLLLPIPAGGQSGAVVRSLACARDKAAAEAAYLRHELEAGIAQTESCNIEAVQRRVITAQMLGVKGVPWIVRADGTSSEGLPQDLAAWLAASSPS